MQRPTRGTGRTWIRKGKEATVWEEWMRAQVGDEVREVTGGQVVWGLGGYHRNFGLYLRESGAVARF